MFNDLNPLPKNESLWFGFSATLIGFVFMALVVCIYLKAGQCCGSRDTPLFGLGKDVKFPIGAV